ncbi:iron complex transport system permease protein [Microbacterium terrae]|uniref:Ferric enterobactin transport system permease protein FepG n=1 Tax=Microbacterium terrae TaxID=69369 RepID=A0A0M2H1Y6_9MICO|nr:iron chelate uptake ABC transporter family permease subunit [Microbacterium terrae]KJL38088.1 Ferric enterobactin transport system permease protein FepG [Microbacterium terrae]MBP1077501.1 iron complex transport system permease protein [Microbacterium terrae]GLJ99106.1 ABC transporter permease [Microbacterium terrae]
MAAPSLTSERPIIDVRAGRLRRRRRRVIAMSVLGALIVILFGAMLMLGNTIYPVSDVIAVLTGQQVPGASFTVGSLRLPRALTAVLAGAAFGVAGATFQTMLRNPLASPDVIGITSGASAAAILSLVILHWSNAATMALAIAAGIGTALVIYVAARGGESTGGRLILIGIGVGAMLDAVVAFLLLRAAVWDLSVATRWMTGSLNGARMDELPPLAIAVVVLVPVVVILGRSLGALELGEASATALGVRVDRTRVLLVVSAVALACVATGTTGPIAFVAFLAGPIALRIVGPGGSPIVPAALTGAALVLAADLIGQFAFDTSFPVGVITGILGAPYLIYLLIRTSRRGGSS